MSQSKPKPHFLVVYIKSGDKLVKNDPLWFSSRCAAVREKRNARAKLGDAFSHADIYPVNERTTN